MGQLSGFNSADWVIIAVVLVSSLISLKRGFIKEFLSLAIWLIAFLVAMLFRPNMETLLAEFIDIPSLLDLASFGVLFVAVLLIGSLINSLIGQLVRITGLTGTDRLLGMIFGFLRGVVILLSLFIFIPKVVPIDQDAWYRESILIPQILLLEDWSRNATSEIYEFVSGLLGEQTFSQVVK